MAKFAILFFAALAFQATLAQYDFYQHNIQHGSTNIQHGSTDNVRNLVEQVQSATREVITAIEQAKVQEHSHALYSAANEFAHNIHEVAYQLQHVIHHTEAGRSQQLLEHVEQILSEAVHQIQKAIHQEPEELKSQFQSQLEKVAAQAEKLVQVIKEEQSGTHHVSEEARDALDDILTAIQELQIHNNIEHASQGEIKSYIRTVTAQVVRAIDAVQTDDKNVAEDLVHHAHHYGHHLGDIVHNLKKGVRSHQINDEQVQNVLKKVTNNLGQIRHSLEEVDQESHQTQHALNHAEHQAEHALNHAEHQAQHKLWLIHATAVYPVHFHEHQEHFEHPSQENYGLGHHSEDKYDQDLKHHSQEKVHKFYDSLKPVSHGSQEMYGQTHGSFRPVDQHTQDIYGQTHGSFRPIGQHTYEQAHQDQDYYGRQSDNIYGAYGQQAHQGFGHLSQDHSAFQPIHHQSQDMYGQGYLKPVGQYYPGGVKGNQYPVLRNLVEELESSVRGVSAQLAQLVDLIQPSEIKEDVNHNVKDLVHTVIAHSLVATRQLQRNVQHTVHHTNQEI